MGGRFVLICLLFAGGALADDDEHLAKIHAQAANDYFVKADYEKALKEFQETYRLSKRPQFLYNLAVCQERLGNLELAVENLERYLRELPEASDRGTVEDRIRNLKARLPPRETPAPVETRARPEKKRPWWVIGVVGGVVAVGLAVGLGVGLGTGGDWSPTLGVDPKK